MKTAATTLFFLIASVAPCPAQTAQELSAQADSAVAVDATGSVQAPRATFVVPAGSDTTPDALSQSLADASRAAIDNSQPRPDVSPRAQAVADLQNAANIQAGIDGTSRGVTAPFTAGATVLVPSTTSVSGFEAASGSVFSSAGSAPVMVIREPAPASMRPLVSLESAPPVAPRAVLLPERNVVGTLLSVDRGRSEITVNEHFTGDNIVFRVDDAQSGRLSRGEIVRVWHEQGSDRANRVETQRS